MSSLTKNAGQGDGRREGDGSGGMPGSAVLLRPLYPCDYEIGLAHPPLYSESKFLNGGQ